MGTLIPRPRPIALGLTLVLSALCSFACSEETVEIPDELIGKPYCMVAASWGHYADGTVHIISDQSTSRSPTGCACALQEARWSVETLTMLNALALEDCKRVAAQYDFAWDDCQQDYESELWLYNVFYVGEDSDDAFYLPLDLHCYDD